MTTTPTTRPSPTATALPGQTERMRVLSIDIDFFVEPVAHWGSFGSVERLSKTEYSVDRHEFVEDFLGRCGLSESKPVPGVFIRHHHQAFDILRCLCHERSTASLVHVDAHSDLGMGDAGYTYIATQLAHLPVSERNTPRRSPTALNEANWLAFAVAAGWLHEVTFVPRKMPNEMHHDLHPWHINDARNRIVIRRATRDQQKSISYGQRDLLQDLPIVESASFKIEKADDFKLVGSPDFAIICQSPQFTPVTADRVLDQCRKRVQTHALQKEVEGPVGWSL